MGPNSTQDGTGKQLPLVTGPVGELGDDWLHAKGPHLPRLTMAAQKSWKNTGMLAGVTDCRRSQKWGCKGRWALGFKPRPGSHRESRPCSSEVNRGPHGSEVNRGNHEVLREKEEGHVVLKWGKGPHGSEGE